MRYVNFVFIFILFGCCQSFGVEKGKNQTQREMNVISKKEFEDSDNRLQSVVNLLAGSLDNEAKKKLEIAENALINYREAHCDAVSFNYKGGSIENFIKFTCLKNITDQRTETLKSDYVQFFEK